MALGPQRAREECRRIGSYLRLLKPTDILVTADNFPEWREHLVYSKQDGKEIKDTVSTRYGTMMVLSSLLLGSELNVLFSPSDPGKNVREAMGERRYDDPRLYIGALIVVDIILTLFTIFSTFTVWGAFRTIDDGNVPVVARSNIGRSMMGIPSRLLVASLYVFFAWVLIVMAWFLPGVLGQVALIGSVAFAFSLVTRCSAFCRLIMYSGAMDGRAQIATDEELREMSPRELDSRLTGLALERKRESAGVRSQYSHSHRS